MLPPGNNHERYNLNSGGNTDREPHDRLSARVLHTVGFPKGNDALGLFSGTAAPSAWQRLRTASPPSPTRYTYFSLYGGRVF
jgi:hypothetical protein